MAPEDRPGPFTRLAELLEACSQRIVERWRIRVDAAMRDHGLSTAELVDHIPAFLAALTTAALALPEDAPAIAASWHETVTGWPSPDHGRQRLREGFDVDEVVREYGILGDVVLATCAELGYAPSIAEVRLLQASLVQGAGEALAAYVRRRDGELQELASRHLAFIAHEVRGPLGAAWIAADLLAGGAMDEQRHALGILRRSLERLQRQIDAVLAVEAPTLVVERAPVSVAAVLHDVREDLLPEAGLKGIDIVCDAADVIEVTGEARLLSSAIGNVVRNAIKFSEPGSAVRIHARDQAGEVRIDVEDRCGGLPRGYESMFQPWVRMSENTGGLGLGLAIARQAIEAHGGWIEVRNRPGVGCVLQIGLPREPSG